MKYTEFKNRNHFTLEELISVSYGTLVDDPPQDFNARLPAPPFLMLDRVLSFESNGKQGAIVAEQDIRLDAWYFQCHMPGDPVQPGCLCVDAIWQLLGFYCMWRGALGAGRALGCDEISFNGQIRPYNKCVRYEIEVRRFTQLKESGVTVIVGNGTVSVDGEVIAHVHNARTGIFKGIVYPDYPRRSVHSVGGIMRNNS
jgi:3-hydroxyacyl-[acyl-carrier protein] dehydratase/trans-2-decenoyl-[acyl-carrier protein] isomerase